MIIKEYFDRYRIDTLGENESIVLTEFELIKRLDNGIWSGDQLIELINQPIVYQTITPYGEYQ